MRAAAACLSVSPNTRKLVSSSRLFLGLRWLFQVLVGEVVRPGSGFLVSLVVSARNKSVSSLGGAVWSNTMMIDADADACDRQE